MKRVFKIAAIIIVIIFLILAVIIKPVSENEKVFELLKQKADSSIQNRHFSQYSASGDTIKTAWAKQNITPDFKVNIVGYGMRGDFNKVHDSLFVRTILFATSKVKVALISYDLLILNHTITDAVKNILKKNNISLDGIYFCTTHTHSSFGGYSKTLLGKFILGGYNQKIIDLISIQTLKTIQTALSDLKNTKIGYCKLKVPHLIYNKLSKTFPFDSNLRVVKLERENKSTALITIFQPHSTLLSGKLNSLSADYPGELNKQLEEDKTCDFSMFCAGAVAYHHAKVYRGYYKDNLFNVYQFFFKTLTKKSFSTFKDVQLYTDSLRKHVKICNTQIKYSNNNRLEFDRFPIELYHGRLRLNHYLQLREWAFRILAGKLAADIKILRIGDIVFIGMPGDFSGEFYPQFDSVSLKKGIFPIITSFNGNYIGYINPDKYYDLDKSDQIQMNWFPKGNSKYIVYIVQKLLEKI